MSKKIKKLYRIFDLTLNTYVVEVGYKYGEEAGYKRDVFTRKQAKQYILAVNYVRVNTLGKSEHEYKLEAIKNV